MIKVLGEAYHSLDNVKIHKYTKFEPNEKRDNKQCLLAGTQWSFWVRVIRYPRMVTVNNKRLISKRKKSEKKYAYTKAMALLRITKGNHSNSIGP